MKLQSSVLPSILRLANASGSVIDVPVGRHRVRSQPEHMVV
jgi:hypothetical protein